MKISKIPGLGRFGVFIDDVDLKNISQEEWLEIGKLHLESLVTIIRNVDITPIEYDALIGKFGSHRVLQHYRVLKKYNVPHAKVLYGKDEINGIPIEDDDKEWLNTTLKMLALEHTVNGETQMMRITGKKDEQGNPLGMFAEGELLWHSNESGELTFGPGVSLYGYHGVVGSATGFLTTADWYEEQSESFRSELDEMIIVHKFTPGKINPGLRADQDRVMYKNMCPEDSEIPLVIKSPIGIRGLHYSVNTVNSIKGMSSEESNKMFEHINKTLFVDKYIYDHWYQNEKDICLFDNSITLHRRLGGVTNRMCYRVQYDYGKILPESYNPYYQDPYKTIFSERIKDINSVLGIEH